MKLSALKFSTQMQAPNDADSRNAALLVQAGFIRKLAAGVYHHLFLGKRTLKKIEQIIREEMDAIEGLEVRMPALVPQANWEQTGRDNVDVGFRTTGANGRDFILGWSHEEAVTPLVGEFIKSYRDLPISVYQIQTKFRNEPRAKSGILRGREFDMKDMYSFHVSQECLESYYERTKQAYLNVFNRCGLNAYIVEASGGSFSDKRSHEFSVICEAGEDLIVINKTNNTAENVEVAQAYAGHKNPEETEIELATVEVNRGTSVTDNAEAHGVPNWKILKSVVYKVDEGFLGISIRGDLQIDMAKLSKYLGTKKVRVANDEELAKLGLVKGYISPINNDKIEFIADESVSTVKNYVTGANMQNMDYIGANIGRDFQFKDTAQLAELTPELFKNSSEDEIELAKAIEVGNIFQLGTTFSDAFGLKYTDEEGKDQKVIMGCYGIGVTRLLGTIVEIHNDEKGMIWPKSVAPYQVQLISLGNEDDLTEYANSLYEELQKTGIEVLFDDRNERAGKKFNDADLIGTPIRVVVSSKLLAAKQVEIKERTENEAKFIAAQELTKYVKEFYEN